MSESNQIINPQADRALSVDFFRGLTMFLLIGESTRIYSHLSGFEESGIIHSIATQFHHHSWNGLYFWDLIQPFFMTIVGVAIPFAIMARKKKGHSDRSILMHTIKRAFVLLLLGWGLYCIGPGQIVWRFQNVLAQLSVTYLVASLIVHKSFKFQIIFSLLILLLIDLAYRFFPVEGFNEPWVVQKNLGAWFNRLIEGTEQTSEWATLNFVSTTAHTIWGALVGILLLNNKSSTYKIALLCGAGALCLIIGYGLDWLHITPIIKKIATSSFVFASGGWTLLAIAFSYWLIDVQKIYVKGSLFFRIVGMNCIAIYLFFSIGGANMLTRVVTPFTTSLLTWAGEFTVNISTDIFVWAAMWGMCYWLYKNRIFIKI
jgi:predicted acyltransferase